MEQVLVYHPRLSIDPEGGVTGGYDLYIAHLSLKHLAELLQVEFRWKIIPSTHLAIDEE